MNKFKPRQPLRMYRDDRNHVSKDSELIDSLIRQQIEIGGVVVYAYRLLGVPPQGRDLVNLRTDPGLDAGLSINSLMGIEDPLYLENRDRQYDFNDIPRLHGVFKVSQNDLIYGQFGPQGMNNDVYTIEFHTRTVEKEMSYKDADGKTISRRFIIGDVLEFPHLKDISATGKVAPKYYAISQVMKSPTGWDQHYVNHVLAVVLQPIKDSQEYIQFMERTDQYGNLLVDQISTGPDIIKVNKALAEKAEELVPTGIWDTSPLYSDPKDKSFRPDWTDYGKPPNGISAGSGNDFPIQPQDYDYFLRTDFVPNRLFQYYDNHWNLKQIDKHMEWQNYAWVAKWQDFLSTRDDEGHK